ncbi:hypothetical protein AB0G04_32460 [Actinoplanes sp. NPDC023801]|uniref:hypothetical protein n=1 Tax=Actinoplanes sp. NPDC023801 TaxID=3154595 RepID=UPI0034106709
MSSTAEQPTTDRAQRALAAAGLAVPADLPVARTRRERHDTSAVSVVRFQRAGYRLGGPHATTVVSDDGTLLGFTNLTVTAPGDLPNKDDAERVAFAFLRRVDRVHADALAVQWVDRHDETITDAAGTTRTIAGIKVKTRHADGRYTWVIVGPDARIVTYERGVTWDRDEGRRGTYMWLHDAWVAAHDGSAAPPPPPYART